VEGAIDMENIGSVPVPDLYLRTVVNWFPQWVNVFARCHTHYHAHG
jgi:hypothetical protein